MASIISGYEYDVFISYRQKDNKGDRWVNKFVEALKEELESTFKEEISVYFDINPNDGLLETHDVNASLKEKLKCLVFIPIISRTYCDPKSFAWEHEFKAFVEQASQDKFKLKIKLPNGNVANRVLPVRIHNLDITDIKLCESLLGGMLRGVEFIYKSSGVNRPLRSKEDIPGDNLSKTFYRDQINKVANAIKEIIVGLKFESVVLMKEGTQHEEPLDEVYKEEKQTEQEKPAKLNKHKMLSGVTILAMLIILAVLVYPKIFKHDKLENLRPHGAIEKSIAVLPFENISDDKENSWLGDAMTDEIIQQLYKVKEFIVRSRPSVMQYKGTIKTTPVIGKELKVNYLIGGSAQRFDDQVRIRVQLINAVTDNLLWGDTFEGKWKDILSIQSEIAKQIAVKLRTVLTPEEKELIEKRQTKYPEAYNLYLQGRFFWNKRTEEGLKKSVEYFKKSVAVDPNYALAYAGLADAYNVLTFWEWYPRIDGYTKAKELAFRALDIDKNLAEAHATLGSLLCFGEWKWEESRKELLRAIELNPNYATAHHYYSELLDILGQNEEARVQINLALELDPFSPVIHILNSLYYYRESKFKESLVACQEGQEIDPDLEFWYWRYFYIYERQGEDLKAVEALQKCMAIDTSTLKYEKSVKEIFNKSGTNGLLNWLIENQLRKPIPSPLDIATWYDILGEKKEALNWLEKAMEERSQNIPRINNGPDFVNLRHEPRFQALCRKMNLPNN